jgi:hypothetical protein
LTFSVGTWLARAMISFDSSSARRKGVEPTHFQSLVEVTSGVFPPFVGVVLPLPLVLLQDLGEIGQKFVFAALAVELEVGPAGVRLEILDKGRGPLYILELHALLTGGSADDAPWPIPATGVLGRPPVWTTVP